MGGGGKEQAEKADGHHQGAVSEEKVRSRPVLTAAEFRRRAGRRFVVSGLSHELLCV
jgi:hypothetical protein